MIAKFAIPAAALAAIVAADSCSFDSATTVTDAGGASSIAACTTIQGDVMFAHGAANPTVSLTSLESISGKLSYTNDPDVSAFFAPKLTEVGGAITFNNCSRMGQISLSALQKSGDVSLVNLGGLSSVTTGKQYSEAGMITIGNTQLTELGGFGNLSKISGIDINGNNLLADVTMNIGMVDIINIGNNEQANQGLNVAFSNLTTAKNITVQKAAAVNFDSLQHVEGVMNIQNGTFSSFSAPNLSYVGALYLSNNAKMSNISLPSLTAINGSDSAALGISNNTALETVGGFPQLQTINGAIIWAGTFKNATGLDSLKVVKGAVNIKSTENIDSLCDEISKLKSSQVLRTNPTCTGSAKNGAVTGGGAGGSNGNGGSGSGSSASGSSGAGHVDIPALPALSAGFGAFLLQFLLSF